MTGEGRGWGVGEGGAVGPGMAQFPYYRYTVHNRFIIRETPSADSMFLSGFNVSKRILSGFNVSKRSNSYNNCSCWPRPAGSKAL